MPDLQELKKLYKLFELKEISRSFCYVNNRDESSAEHTYSTLILAQYFLQKVSVQLDELKVMKMLLYHDIIEIEAGDTYFYDDNKKASQNKREQDALETIKTKIPLELYNELRKYWLEFEGENTIESKFCKAIDKIDPIVHNMHNKDAWQKAKITEYLLRTKKEKYFDDFPELKDAFNNLIKHISDNNLFSK